MGDEAPKSTTSRKTRAAKATPVSAVSTVAVAAVEDPQLQAGDAWAETEAEQIKVEAVGAEFSISQPVLLSALRTASSAVLKDDSRPVLKHLLVEVRENGTVAIAAYNMKVGVRVVVPATVNSSGRFLISPTRMLAYLAKVPEGMVRIEIDPTAKELSLTQPGIIFTERLGTVGDYPDLVEKTRGYESYWLDSAELRRALEGVRFAAANDEKDPLLSSVLLQVWGEGEDASFTTIATNRKVMAIYDLKPDDVEAPSAQFIIPKDAIAAVIGTTYRGERVKCSPLQDSFVRFETTWRDSEHDEHDSSTTVEVRLTDGTFPNVRALIPPSPTSSAEVDWQMLTDAFSRQHQAIAEQKGGSVTVAIEHELLIISAQINGRLSREELSADTQRTGLIQLPLAPLTDAAKVVCTVIRISLDYAAAKGKEEIGENEDNRAMLECVGTPFKVVMMKMVTAAVPAAESTKKGKGKAKS